MQLGPDFPPQLHLVNFNNSHYFCLPLLVRAASVGKGVDVAVGFGEAGGVGVDVGVEVGVSVRAFACG